MSSPSLRQSSTALLLVPLWAVVVVILGHNGPQPLGDRLGMALDQPPADTVVRVTVASRAPIRAWQRTVELARQRGAIAVGVVGPDLPPESVEAVTFATGKKAQLSPQISEAGLPPDRDGITLRFLPHTALGPTFPTRLMLKAGVDPPMATKRISMSSHPLPKLNAAQLRTLDENALSGKIVVVSGAEPWGTASIATPRGLVSMAEVIGRSISSPMNRWVRPWATLFAFALSGLVLVRALEGRQLKFLRLSGLLTVAVVFFAGVCHRQGQSIPVDTLLIALWGGLGILRWTQPADSLHDTGSADRWERVCERALLQTDGLACWMAVRQDEDWIAVAQRGDAGELPVESLERILGQEPPQGADRAFVAAAKPDPQGISMALILQPGDAPRLDPQSVVSTLADLLGELG